MSYRPCAQVEPGCKAAPALADSHTRATCFACGLPVCTNKGDEHNAGCSRVIVWHRYGRQRVCRRCEVDERRTA